MSWGFLKENGSKSQFKHCRLKHSRKNGCFERHKYKKNQDKFKKYVDLSSQNTKHDGKPESFKKGEGTSNLIQQKTQRKDKKHIQCYNYEKRGHCVSYLW